MEENRFTADGLSDHCDVREEGGWWMNIPRKKRSPRVQIFDKERMMRESSLKMLASVESNKRLPVEKRKIRFFLLSEENRKKRKPSLNSMEIEVMELKRGRNEFGVFDDELLYCAFTLWRMSQEVPETNKTEKTIIAKPLKTTPELKPPIQKVQPPMPEALAEKLRGMGGERVELVIQKQLTHTDVNSKNSRLSIPSNQKRADFLSESEKKILSKNVPGTMTKRGIAVLVIDPSLEEMNLRLKMWKMNSIVYNLIENWNKLVEENGLEEGNTIQLWVFRVKERSRRGLSDLCFALVKLEEDNNGGDDDTV